MHTGKRRNDSAEDQQIGARLRAFTDITKRLVAEGKTPEQASAEAMAEIKAGRVRRVGGAWTWTPGK